jgi:hypothetical protein
MTSEIIDKVKGRLRDDEVRLLDRILFKFNNILEYFNKSNPRYVARLDVYVTDSELFGRRIVSFTVYVSRRDDSVEGEVVIQFYYDLDAREGAFSGLYCDVCWLSPEDALEILRLASQLVLVFYGGVVV